MKLLSIGTFLLLSANVLAERPTPLHDAAARGDVRSVRSQLKNGANPNLKNADKLTPLHLAARHGHLEIARLLLENGADPNQRQIRPGPTPLHIAVEYNHAEVVSLLLERGANPNIAVLYDSRGSRMPLQIAARNGYAEIAQLLLENRARLGGRCVDCKAQLLHIAAWNGHVGLARLLLDRGGNPNTKWGGRLPAQIAAQHGHAELTLLLRGNHSTAGTRLSPPTTSGPQLQGSKIEEIIEDARRWALRFTENLPNFVCTQITRRSDNKGRGEKAWRRRHDIVVKVQFVDGVESYDTVTVNGKRSEKHIREISGVGEFGSTLHSLFKDDSLARFTYVGDEVTNGQPAVIFKVTHPYGYELYTGVERDGFLQNYIRVGYQGFIHIAKDSSVVLRVTGERIFGVPPNYPVRQSSFQIDYGAVDIGGSSYWLPVESRDVLVGRGGWINQNDNTWIDYRKFAAETTLDFGD